MSNHYELEEAPKELHFVQYVSISGRSVINVPYTTKASAEKTMEALLRPARILKYQLVEIGETVNPKAALKPRNLRKIRKIRKSK